MFKNLYIYNSFLKENVKATVSNYPIYVTGQKANNQSKYAKAYICGPTVYDHSHIGHALTYIRFDLFKRVLNNFCSTNLITIMNITDIDDKIILKANEKKKDYKEITNEYLISFLNDLKYLNILPLDTFIRVTDHIDLIINFIQKLELNNYTYIDSKTNDILFDVSKVEDYPKLTIESDKSEGKKSNKDFVLWKSYKEEEPYWFYESKLLNKKFKGRPGWHVECSAICNYTLGNEIDFHLGGKDLYFPHHINEATCYKAYIQSIYKKNIIIHSWSKVWIHFGKLLIKNVKMSKSLNNYISIKNFLENNHCNILRLLCILKGFRTDLSYDENLFNEVTKINTKIENFILFLNEEKIRLLKKKSDNIEYINIDEFITEFNNLNLDGISNNLDLSVGLKAFINLLEKCKKVNLTIFQLVKLDNTLKNYLNSLGLSFNLLNEHQNLNNLNIINTFIQYRKLVRKNILEEIVNKNNTNNNLKNLLYETDNLRKNLKKYQISISDEKFIKKI